MHRDLGNLTSHRFDLLVVGGGIYGLVCACDAAQRGLTVALVERSDFGSGSSFNHLRTIHGGLRYLQSLDIARARESVRERRTLARIAAPALRPLPFVLPLRASLTQGPSAMRAGFMLDRIVAADRNEGVPDTHVLPAGVVLSPGAAAERFPALRGRDIAGAAVWYDYVTTAPDRLTWAWAAAAAQHGAVIANYVEASDLVLEGARVAGVDARDCRTGTAFRIHARVVVNATGGAIDGLPDRARHPIGTPMIHALNLVTSRQAPDHALGGRTREGRALFMVPSAGRAVFGTWESPRPVTADSRPSTADVAAFLDEINDAFPGAAVALEDVTRVQFGTVPATRGHGGRYSLAGSEHIHDHTAAGLAGLLSIAGTKYTTARAVAERVVDAVYEQLGAGSPACRTAVLPLPIVSPQGDDDGLRTVTRGEMVVTLEDAVMRRTSLATLSHPGRGVLEHAAAIVGEQLGWSGERRAAEIAGVERRYGTSKA